MSASPASSRPAALRLSPACDLGEVRAIARAVRQFLAAQGCGEAELHACELALVEACNNAIKYAAPAAAPKHLVVDCLCDAQQVELRVHDHTRGFDWPTQASLPAAESENGRGLYLIRTLMDAANYFRAADENVLVLHKYRAPGATSAPPATDADVVVAELVEELSSCYESLSAIFRHRAAQANTGELKEFAQRLLADLLQITNADWFVLRLTPEGEARLEVFAVSEPGLQLAPLAIGAPGPERRSVELDAASSRRVIWFDADHPLAAGDPLGAIKPGSQGLVHPIFTGEGLVGTLTIGKNASLQAGPARPAGLVFTAGQTNVVGTFTEFLAIQVVNARFQEEMVASRLVAHELEIANNIQQSLLPKELASLPGFQVAASCRSARQVGGDFYDVLRISDHTMLLVIADVMGKGVPAAMFAAILRTMVRAAPELAHQPSALLTRVNRLLFDELSGVDMFITAQLGYLDALTCKLVIASAGHCPVLFDSGTGGPVQQVSPEGMPLGVMSDTVFAEEVIQLGPQSRVLFYTDGLPEAQNGQGERFGQERLIEWFQTTARGQHSAEELKRSLSATLSQFQATMVLNDDQTFLIMSA